jgi:LemA protein
MLVLWIILAVVVLLILIAIFYFNRFVVLSNRIDNSLSQIDVQLKRRADLIPNLIETVKGYAKHEKSIMEDVSKARKAMMAAKDIVGKVKANDVLSGALGRLFAVAENYPDLKASSNFIELQRELSSTEDRVAYARQNYNDSILSYNNIIQKFPGAMFAGMYGRKAKQYLQIAEVEKKAPKVSF